MSESNGAGRLVEILTGLRIFIDDGQVTELRAFRGGQTLCNAMYRDLPAMAARALEVEAAGATGVYFTLNPIRPELLPAAVRFRDRSSVKADGIARRCWLPIDTDPERFGPGGEVLVGEHSSTDAERAVAWEVTGNCRALLEAAGFAGAVLGDSGNGWHLCYPIDLDNDQASYDAVAAILAGLQSRCGTPEVEVDQKNKDAPRIWKLYGTLVRKGDGAGDRPHRYSRIVEGTRPTQEVRESNNEALARLLALWQRQAEMLRRPAVKPEVNLEERVIEYLEKCAPAVSGDDGHGKLFEIAREVVYGFNVGPEVGFRLLWDHYNPKCLPPWTERELQHKCEDADTKPYSKPRGWKLTEERNGHRPGRNGRAVAPSNGTGPIPEEEPVTYCASTVKTKKVEWLWPRRIPANKLTTVAGQMGIGKTFLLCDIAARLSAGSDWPDTPGVPVPAGDVLFISGEDDEDDTLVPRLIECGADLDRIRFLSLKALTTYTLANLRMLDRAHAETNGRLRLVVIDPPTSYLGDVDDHKNAELRRLLTPLKLWTKERCCAVVLNTHLNKGGGQKVEAIFRVIGSIAWMAAVRTGHLVATDPDDDTKRFFIPMKINIGKKPQGLTYTLEDASEDMARVRWLGGIDLSADQAVNREKAKPRRIVASEWLIERFREKRSWDGDDLFKAARAANISRSAVFEAKELLDLPKARKITNENGDVCWNWWVPDDWEHLTTAESEVI